MSTETKKDFTENLCPCSSGMSYALCCQPFHEGDLPKNALQLMRSRFSAYVMDKPDYIIATTHPANPQYSENKLMWRRGISQFSQSSQFEKLEILDFKENDTLATVTFTAYLTQKGQDATFTEKSYFEKFKNRWLYRAGQLSQGHAPNLVTTDQLRILPLAYYGDPILRRVGDPIGEITADIKKLVEEMIETMDACNGLGIAAPQVHHSIKLFVIRVPIEDGKGKVEIGPVKVFINPVVSDPSEESWRANEGCLSIPTINHEVDRPKEITVEYTNLQGERIKERVSGWHAKVILHENDHINGILFIDHLTQEELAKLQPFLKNLENRIHNGNEL